MPGGSALVATFAEGLLGFFRPAWQLGDVLLAEVTAGGDLGHLLSATPAGALVWLLSGAAAFWIASPHGAAATARGFAAGARTVWSWRLPERAWSSAHALIDLIFPTRTPPHGVEKVPLDTVIWAQQSEPEPELEREPPAAAPEPVPPVKGFLKFCGSRSAIWVASMVAVYTPSFWTP